MGIEKYLERFTPREQRMIIVLIVTAIFFILYELIFVFFLPQMQKKETELVNAQNELTLARQRVENSTLIQEELQQKEKKNKELKRYFDGSLTDGTIYNNLGVAARKSNVKITVLTPGAITESDFYKKMPLTLSFEGDYASLKKMLKEIDNFRPILLINTFELKKGDGEMLSLKLNLTAYGSKEKESLVQVPSTGLKNVNPFLGENKIALSSAPQEPLPKEEASSLSPSSSPAVVMPSLPPKGENQEEGEKEEAEEEFLCPNPYSFPLLLSPPTTPNFNFPVN